MSKSNVSVNIRFTHLVIMDTITCETIIYRPHGSYPMFVIGTFRIFPGGGGIQGVPITIKKTAAHEQRLVNNQYPCPLPPPPLLNPQMT